MSRSATAGPPRRPRDRGVALLIVLLVTALMIALVFEFAFGTRVSLRAAVNFRDSQRAYFLARSGVSFAGKALSDHLKNNKPLEDLEQREWQIVPIVSAGDVELRVRWDDEAGKINIANVRTGNPSLKRLDWLLAAKGIGDDVLEAINAKQELKLTSELHEVMSDEEFGKIQESVTVFGADKIDINTASSDVLQSLGMSELLASRIIERRKQEPFDSLSRINEFPGMETAIAGMLDVTSNVFLVRSYATVGGYTKQAEAVIVRSASGFTIKYWRIL